MRVLERSDPDPHLGRGERTAATRRCDCKPPSPKRPRIVERSPAGPSEEDPTKVILIYRAQSCQRSSSCKSATAGIPVAFVVAAQPHSTAHRPGRLTAHRASSLPRPASKHGNNHVPTYHVTTRSRGPQPTYGPTASPRPRAIALGHVCRRWYKECPLAVACPLPQSERSRSLSHRSRCRPRRPSTPAVFRDPA